MEIWVKRQDYLYFQWKFSIYREITFCSRACQILIFNVIRFEVGAGGKTFPKHYHCKFCLKPSLPLSKAPDLDITNSNSGTLLFVNIRHFQYQYFILTCFSHLLGKLCSSWSKYRGNTILTSKLAKFNSLEIKAYSRWDHHLNVNLQEKQQWWCFFYRMADGFREENMEQKQVPFR